MDDIKSSIEVLSIDGFAYPDTGPTKRTLSINTGYVVIYFVICITTVQTVVLCAF